MQLNEGGEGGVDLVFGAGLQDMEQNPFARAASCTPLMMRSAILPSFGFTSRAITLA